MSRKPLPPPKARIPPFDEARVRAAAHAAVMAAQTELVVFARSEADIFRRRILAQRFPSFKAKPLSEATLAKKARFGRSLKVMVSTGTYADGIQAIVRQNKKGGLSVFIGFPSRLRARDTATGRPRQGVSMASVARWQEMGAPRAHIPARPHWGPALAAMKRRSPAAKMRLMALARSAFLRNLRRRA